MPPRRLSHEDRRRRLIDMGFWRVSFGSVYPALRRLKAADAVEVSETKDEKGRHTTSNQELHLMNDGSVLIDTPGMRELQLTDVKAGLDDVFAEISTLADNCRFTDCAHVDEPGCRVRSAIEAGDIDQARLDRWRKLKREEAHNSSSIAERRARDKSFASMCKNVMSEKKSRRGH